MNILRHLLTDHPKGRLRFPTKEQCGHCHAYLEPDDRYCRQCGTKVGDGAYAPYLDLMQCIYGPPPEEREHICQQCGYKWTTYRMIDDQKYCPKCGGPASAVRQIDTPVSIITLTDIHAEDKCFQDVIGKSLLIGRSINADIRIDYDQSVSREHCEILREGDSFYIINHSQINRTMLNGERIEKKTPIVDGAIIKMGRVEMRVNIQNVEQDGSTSAD